MACAVSSLYIHTPKNNVLGVSGTKGRGHWFSCASVVGGVKVTTARRMHTQSGITDWHVKACSIIYIKNLRPKHLGTGCYINNILRPENLNFKERPYVISGVPDEFISCIKKGQLTIIGKLCFLICLLPACLIIPEIWRSFVEAVKRMVIVSDWMK